jgi:DNA-binding CsgD family transcriptional regulator
MLSIVEAAYRVDVPAQNWGARLLQATEGAIGGGIGGFACSFAWDDQACLRFDKESAVVLGVPGDMLTAILDGLAKSPPHWLHQHLTQPRGSALCVLTSEVDPEVELAYRPTLAARGISDGVNLVALDVNDRGFLLSLGVPSSFKMARGVRHSLRRAGTHVLAALRLRARLARLSAPEHPDAVLCPTGKLLHADGEASLSTARRALQTATRVIEEARASSRDDSALALESWKGLVASRWSLVDSFQQDGQRYVIARENLPPVTGPAALTPTERAVLTYLGRGSSTKETAYALGVSDSTVRVLLMRAARRCGVSTRKELLDLWNNERLRSA